MNTVVYTRFVYDSPYIDSFISHYRSLGFAKIIILFHESYLKDKKYIGLLDKESISYDISNIIKKKIHEKKYLDKKYIADDSVIIHPVRNHKNSLPSRFSHIIPDETDWVLNVDSDEYLLINNKFRDITELITHALEEKPELYCIEFKWIWVTNCVHSKNKPLEYVIQKYGCYEHYMLKTEMLLNIKTLQRFSKGIKFTAHSAYGNASNKYKYTVNKYYSPCDKRENTLKVNENSLGLLIHIRLRSFYNMVFKCVNMFSKSVPSKNASMKDDRIINFLKEPAEELGKEDAEKLFLQLYELDTLKYEKRHVNNILSRKELVTSHFVGCISGNTFPLVDKEKEKEFYLSWIKKNFKDKLSEGSLDNMLNNIKFYNKILQWVTRIKSKRELDIFVKQL